MRAEDHQGRPQLRCSVMKRIPIENLYDEGYKAGQRTLIAERDELAAQLIALRRAAEDLLLERTAEARRTLHNMLRDLES